MMKGEKGFDLEERLIDHAVKIIQVTESLPKSMTGKHIAGQLVRSGTSPAANYGEAQSAESRADFIHKMKMALKELRESRVWMLMVVKANIVKQPTKLDPIIEENNQLISIFVKSISTAQKNSRKIQPSK